MGLALRISWRPPTRDGVVGSFALDITMLSCSMSNDGRIRPDGKPQEFFSLTLLSEGQFMIEGMPRTVWRGLMTGLGVGASRADRRKILDSYWPPDQPRPWYWPRGLREPGHARAT